MIVTITYNNPISNNEEDLIIDIDSPRYDYADFINNLALLYIGDIYKELNSILADLDCTRIFKSGRPMMIEYSQYKINIAKFLKLLYKIPGYSIYNEYIDKLINRHIENILFEFNNPIVKKKPTNSKKQKAKPNKWIKAVTNDIFTGEERYIYENLKTGEIITSGNPDLLETLNTKKEKKTKEVKVREQVDTSLKYVTFSFNKK